MIVMNRREFLRLSGTGAVAALVPSIPTIPTPSIPRVNGGINIAPLRRFELDAGYTPPLIVPRLVDIQMGLIYRLGFEQIRITISFEGFGPNFLAAIPYVRAARALGIDVVGIIGEFSGVDLVRALANPETREEVLETYVRIFDAFVPAASDAVGRPGRFALQILNEPSFSYGMAPEVYVREFLRPAYLHLKEDDPSIQVVSAAPVSSAEGFLRLQKMIETGVEHVCDRVALHVYSTRFIERLGKLTEKPVWITESGVEGPSRHLDWFTSTFGEIRSNIPTAEQIYWYDLFDKQPNGFRLFDIAPDPLEDFVAVPESTDLIHYLEAQVEEASGGAATASYEALVPDIMLYFPTEEDIRLIESTSFGLPDGLAG